VGLSPNESSRMAAMARADQALADLVERAPVDALHKVIASLRLAPPDQDVIVCAGSGRQILEACVTVALFQVAEAIRRRGQNGSAEVPA
jgi:hypothetical protein